MLPSYFGDSTDIINKISEIYDLPETSLLLTLNITSLHTGTSILHKKGLSALSFRVLD